MLIEVDTSVVNHALDGDLKAADAIEKVMTSYQYGLHLIFIGIKDLNSILKSKIFGLSTKRKLEILLTKSVENHINREDFCPRINITLRENTGWNGDVLYVNPNDDLKIRFDLSTTILAENLLDIDLFEVITHWWKQNQQNLKVYNISINRLGGGGSTIAQSYRYEIKSGLRPVLAIVDSDRKCPDPVDYLGNTATSIKSVHDECTPLNARYYVLSNVREIENLIPLRLILDSNCYHKHELLDNWENIDTAFLDMKLGLRGAYIDHDNVKNHWTFQNISEEKKNQIAICRECNLNNYHEGKECDCSRNKEKSLEIIKGFGEGMMNNTVKDKLKKIKKIKNYYLKPFQQQEWENIGKLVFFWCCASEPCRL